MACAARLFRIPEPDDNMFPEKVASTANVRRQAADFVGHLRARAAEFPHHVALHWPPMATPPLGTRCSRWFASQAPRGRRARLGRADEGAQPQRIAPTNENLRGVGARTAFRAEDGWFRGHSTTTDAWEAFMLRPGDDWDGLGAAPHALSEPPIRIWKRGWHEQDRHGVPCWAKRGNRSTVAHAGPSPRVVRLLGHTIPEDGRQRARIDGARRGARAPRKSHDGEGWWKMPLEAAVFVGNKINK